MYEKHKYKKKKIKRMKPKTNKRIVQNQEFSKKK